VWSLPLGGIFTPSFTPMGEHYLICTRMVGTTSPLGDKVHLWGQSSPLVTNFAPRGQSLPLGNNLSPRG
jgi:hypothetical protein